MYGGEEEQGKGRGNLVSICVYGAFYFMCVAGIAYIGAWFSTETDLSDATNPITSSFVHLPNTVASAAKTVKIVEGGKVVFRNKKGHGLLGAPYSHKKKTRGSVSPKWIVITPESNTSSSRRPHQHHRFHKTKNSSTRSIITNNHNFTNSSDEYTSSASLTKIIHADKNNNITTAAEEHVPSSVNSSVIGTNINSSAVFDKEAIIIREKNVSDDQLQTSTPDYEEDYELEENDPTPVVVTDDAGNVTGNNSNVYNDDSYPEYSDLMGGGGMENNGAAGDERYAGQRVVVRPRDNHYPKHQNPVDGADASNNMTR